LYQLYTARREPLLISLGRISLGLFSRRPSINGHQLMRARAIICSARSACLAKSVSRALIEASLVTSLAKPIAKASN